MRSLPFKILSRKGDQDVDHVHQGSIKKRTRIFLFFPIVVSDIAEEEGKSRLSQIMQMVFVSFINADIASLPLTFDAVTLYISFVSIAEFLVVRLTARSGSVYVAGGECIKMCWIWVKVLE